MPTPPARTHHPPLIRSKIDEMLAPLTVYASDPRQRAQLPPADALAILDLIAAYSVAQHAQTILFSTAQALALKPALERFGEDLLEYRLPFPFTLIQFSAPIAEAQLLPYPEELPGPFAAETGADKILALLLSQSEDQQGQLLNSAGAWFQSGAVNRITWVNEQQAHLRLPQPDLPDAAERLANKARLRNLAIACIAYINCENITLERQTADAKVNRSRVSKGKKPFDDYYLCRLRTARGQEEDEAGESGGGPSYRFDVRGYFRRLPNGKLIWVRPHQRGLAHELYVPAVRKVG
jgi:hypothetical protein